jgi:acetyltransferase-like isoleucine patch superfamily enzyme
MSARRLIKRVVFGICLFLVSPAILASWIEKRTSSSEAIFVGVGQFLALVPSLLGAHIRAAYYFGSLLKCSWEVHIGFGSLFTHRGAALGTRVSMGAYCVIGHADIGDDVMMASRISVPSGKRQHLDESGQLSAIPKFDRVALGKGSWIGEGAIIMATVGESCIVSAGAVVVKEMPGDCLIGGNPAVVIKKLDLRRTL